MNNVDFAHAACNSCECCPHFCRNQAFHELCTDSFPLLVFILTFSLALFTDAYLAHFRSENQNKLTLLAEVHKSFTANKICASSSQKYNFSLCWHAHFYIFPCKMHSNLKLTTCPLGALFPCPHLLWGEPLGAGKVAIHNFRAHGPRRVCEYDFCGAQSVRLMQNLNEIGQHQWIFPIPFFLALVLTLQSVCSQVKGKCLMVFGQKGIANDPFQNSQFQYCLRLWLAQVNREFKMKLCDMWAEFSPFKSEIICFSRAVFNLTTPLSSKIKQVLCVKFVDEILRLRQKRVIQTKHSPCASRAAPSRLHQKQK